MPDTRRNLQVNQPGIEGNEPNDKNGWPTPLTSPLDPLKIKVTNGSNGSQSFKTLMATQGQDQLSLTEGRSSVNAGDQGNQGGHSNKWRTSQQNAGDHSQTEGE